LLLSSDKKKKRKPSPSPASRSSVEKGDLYSGEVAMVSPIRRKRKGGKKPRKKRVMANKLCGLTSVDNSEAN